MQTYSQTAVQPIANLIILPRGSHLFDLICNRPGRVDFGVVDVAHSAVVAPDDVLVLVPEAHVLSSEHVPRMDGLARSLVEADDADHEIDLARIERLLFHSEQRAV